MKFFRNKISVFTPKISEDLFLVIDHDFRIFPIFLKISHIFAASNVVYDPFFTRKTLISEDNSLMTPFFYSVHAFARVRQTLLLKILGGRMYGPSPHLKFCWGAVRPVPPRSPLMHQPLRMERN